MKNLLIDTSCDCKECNFCNRKFQLHHIYTGSLHLKYHNNANNITNLDINICKHCIIDVYEDKIFLCANCKCLYLLDSNKHFISYFNNQDKYCENCFNLI